MKKCFNKICTRAKTAVTLQPQNGKRHNVTPGRKKRTLTEMPQDKQRHRN